MLILIRGGSECGEGDFCTMEFIWFTLIRDYFYWKRLLSGYTLHCTCYLFGPVTGGKSGKIVF